MSLRRSLTCLAAGILLAGCQSPVARNQVAPTPGGPCPSGVASMIDRIDFVVFSGIMYTTGLASSGRRLAENDLAAPYAMVRCKLADNNFDPSYNQVQDGNAAFLSPGTVLYRVNGYSPSFRIAARRDGQIVLYESDTNPTAHRGADLLDLAGKVTKISIDSDTGDGTNQLAAITDQAMVDNAVRLLLRAPVDQHSTAGHGGSRYFLVFQLIDGTTVMRAYFRSSGEVSRGILAPPEFQSAINKAVAAAAK